MKTKHYFMMAAIVATSLSLSSCGNKNKQTAANEDQTEVAQSAALQIDDVLAQADSLVGQEITIEGICTHACKHGATKIFLMGSDDTQTIRVEAAKLGAFDTKCVNNVVEVKGILYEDRIDEAYLQAWEAEEKNGTAEKHGEEGEGGCSSEKAARGETANTTAERIADFRTKIEKRNAEEGKAYLSFYHVEALSYEIK